MLKQALSHFRSSRLLTRAATFVFYGYVLITIATAALPSLSDQSFVSRQHLFEDDRSYFQNPSDAFLIFKPHIPSKESLSFIMDFPFNRYSMIVEQLFTAQNCLAPLVLNPYPLEKTALVFCSSDLIARDRTQSTGYQMQTVLADGKGIARKNL